MMRTLTFGLVLALSACGGAAKTPATGDPQALSYQPHWRTAEEIQALDGAITPPLRCDLPQGAGVGVVPAAVAPLLAPGDEVELTIPEGDEFAGVRAVDADGALHLPMIAPIPATGRTPDEVAGIIAARLVEAGIFRADFINVTVAPRRWQAIEVTVEGAVFQPGAASLNNRKADDAPASDALTGDHAPGRSIAAALRAAAGVRPDADVSAVVVERAGTRMVLDLRPAVTGGVLPDVPLTAGDRIIVPSRDCFQDALMRPTPITAPGMRVFLSNLTTPAASNAQSAIGKDATSLPYGTRMLQGLVAANCVGGNGATNSDRVGVLVSSDPVTGKSVVVHRAIEDLLADPGRDDVNPFLMPNDAIACYEGGVSTVRDVVRAIGEMLGPFALLSVL
jgi:protein involved in polysaccharide export with SLBB domain